MPPVTSKMVKKFSENPFDDKGEKNKRIEMFKKRSQS